MAAQAAAQSEALHSPAADGAAAEATVGDSLQQAGTDAHMGDDACAVDGVVAARGGKKHSEQFCHHVSHEMWGHGSTRIRGGGSRGAGLQLWCLKCARRASDVQTQRTDHRARGETRRAFSLLLHAAADARVSCRA
jgi:hypothetical protein